MARLRTDGPVVEGPPGGAQTAIDHARAVLRCLQPVLARASNLSDGGSACSTTESNHPRSNRGPDCSEPADMATAHEARIPAFPQGPMLMIKRNLHQRTAPTGTGRGGLRGHGQHRRRHRHRRRPTRLAPPGPQRRRGPRHGAALERRNHLTGTPVPGAPRPHRTVLSPAAVALGASAPQARARVNRQATGSRGERRSDRREAPARAASPRRRHRRPAARGAHPEGGREPEAGPAPPTLTGQASTPATPATTREPAADRTTRAPGSRTDNDNGPPRR